MNDTLLLILFLFGPFLVGCGFGWILADGPSRRSLEWTADDAADEAWEDFEP